MTICFSPNQSEFRRFHYPIFTRGFSSLVKKIKSKVTFYLGDSELEFFFSEKLSLSLFIVFVLYFIILAGSCYDLRSRYQSRYQVGNS